MKGIQSKHTSKIVCVRWKGREKWLETMSKNRKVRGESSHAGRGTRGHSAHGVVSVMVESRGDFCWCDRSSTLREGPEGKQTHKQTSDFCITRNNKVRSLYCVPSGWIWTKSMQTQQLNFLKITLIRLETTEACASFCLQPRYISLPSQSRLWSCSAMLLKC